LRHTNVPAGRYDFHELIRQYADLKLQDSPKEHIQTHEEHANYYAALLHQWESQLQGPRQQEILAAGSVEIDNLRRAWDWMVTHRQASNLQQSLFGLFELYDIRNWSQEGSILFGQAVAALGPQEMANGEQSPEVSVLGELMACQGHMCWHLGQTQRARDLLQQSLRFLRSSNNRAMLAEAVLYLSVVEHSQGDFPTARQLAEECVSLNREQGRLSGLGYALSNLGMICLTQGENETAFRSLEEAVAVMQSIDHPRGIATSLTRLGAAALRLGKFTEAQHLLDESLEITRRLGDRWGTGNTLNYLGMLALARGDLEHAETLVRDSVTLFKEDADQILLATTLTDLGYILNERSAEPEAGQVFWQALQIAWDSRVPPIALYALVGIATLYTKEGARELALELAMHSQGHASSSWQTRERAEQLRANLETQLTPRQLETVKARVQGKTFEALVQRMLAS
jgi:tetratricopeptide (TPR) repeat protein